MPRTSARAAEAKTTWVNIANFNGAMTTDNQVQFKTWMCLICGFIYDEAAGLPGEGIAPGTRWDDVPMNWTCPECGARKDDFEMVEI
jgi:rubredoxin